MAIIRALFSGIDAFGARNLWFTDGTPGGTTELTRAGVGATPFGGVVPLSITPFGTGALFEGTDINGNLQVWITDSSVAGTLELTTGGPQNTGLPGGVLSFGSPDFTTLGNNVLFRGLDTGFKFGLWTTSGTAAGTSELNVAGANSQGLFIGSADPGFTVIGNKVLFAGLDSSSKSGLWVTDGTAGGTTEFTVVGANSFAGLFGVDLVVNPDFTVLGNKIIFAGEDNSGHVGLWVTDGTSIGTTPLAVIGANSGGLFGFAGYNNFTVLGNKAIFAGLDSSGHNQLWITDGTSAGTTELGVAGASSSGLAPSKITKFGNKALFSGHDANGATDLWVTDGTSAGTVQITSGLFGGVTVNPSDLTVLGSLAVFQGPGNFLSDGGLWVTDGTTAGTHQLMISSVADLGIFQGINNPDFTVVGDRVIFEGRDAGLNYGLWMTDGTAAGTVEVGGVSNASFTGLQPGQFAALAVPPPPSQSPVILADFGWAQGWGSPDNPRITSDADGNGTADYVGFGAQSVFIAYGGTFAGSQGTGPGFSRAVAEVNDFGTLDGYTSSVQRGLAATGVGVGETIYGQGFAGVYWYAATGETPQTDAGGKTYNVLQYQGTPNLYGNFGSQQGWTPSNGFQIIKAAATDSTASILGFGASGIVVGPQAFAAGATAASSYVIPFAAGNDFGWSQQVDIRTFTDAAGNTIDLNKDGVADFVGMGPQGLAYAFGSETGGTYGLGALQTAHISGGAADLGEAQGWNDATTLRYIVGDKQTGFDDILAFGAAGVYVAMGQDPATHNGEAFGQLYLAMPDFGSDQGWSVSQTPRIVGDVNGDGIPDIVGFGANATFAALGSHDAEGNLHFLLDQSQTINDFGFNEAWSGPDPQTVRTLGNVAGAGHSDLVLSGAFNTQVWQFS